MLFVMRTDILIVEDSAALTQAYMEYLRNEPWVVSHVDDGAKALEFIYQEKPKVVVLDLMLPDMNGMDILRAIHSDELDVSVIMATGTGTHAESKAAIELGARDFLEKPISANRFVTTLRNALEHSELENIVDEFDSKHRSTYHEFVGSSAPMQLVYQTIDQVASSNVPVFITGESGTGKEVCAKSIHLESERAEKPFIALNCAAIPHDLVESEIFGHVKGAFTGAVSNRDGAATQAQNGTLFLDEIAEMDIDLQAKLLRFIQTQTFQKVGGSKTEKVNVRFVCATNRNAFEAVEQGKFREDLYYRLNVISIEMPPLRKRGNDIHTIATHFLKQFALEEGKQIKKFTDDAVKGLKQHRWPGNVRELQNVVRRAVVMQVNNVKSEIAFNDLNLNFDGEKQGSQQGQIDHREQIKQNTNNSYNNKNKGTSNSELLAAIKPLAQIEQEAIEQAIDLCNQNIPKAAALLDVSPSTIYRKIQNWKEG